MQPEDPRVSPTLGVPPRPDAPQPVMGQPSAAPQPQMQQPMQPQPQYQQQPAPMQQQYAQPAAPQQPVRPQPSAPVMQQAPQQMPPAAQPATSVPQQPTPMQAPEALEQQYYDEQGPEGLQDQDYYDEGGDQGDMSEDMSDAVNWQAAEYIQRDKDTKWFVVFGVVMVALAAVAIFLMDSPTFAAVLAAITAVIIVFAKRPPRVINYALTAKGLYIGDTLHRFADFKSFGVIRDDDEFSVTLIPTKRFMPSVTVYFPEESGEAIVDMLGTRLPMRDLKLDTVDRIVRKLRL